MKSAYASTFNMSKRSFHAYLDTKFICACVCVCVCVCVGTVFQIYWPANLDRIQDCIMAGKNLQVKHDFMYHSWPWRQLFLKCLITNKLNHYNFHCLDRLLVLPVLKLIRPLKAVFVHECLFPVCHRWTVLTSCVC